MLRAWLPVAAGFAGALAGGWLAGGMLGLGLVLIAGSAAVIVLAFPLGARERREPRMPEGGHEVADVLDYVRRLP